jgi:hypothetical protein
MLLQQQVSRLFTIGRDHYLGLVSTCAATGDYRPQCADYLMRELLKSSCRQPHSSDSEMDLLNLVKKNGEEKKSKCY